jgi:hypothetical protein
VSQLHTGMPELGPSESLCWSPLLESMPAVYSELSSAVLGFASGDWRHSTVLSLGHGSANEFSASRGQTRISYPRAEWSPDRGEVRLVFPFLSKCSWI